MKEKEAEFLLNKYLEGKCSPEEKIFVERSYNLAEEDSPELSTEPNYEDWHHKIKDQLPKAQHRIFPWKRLVSAAAVLLLLGMGLFFAKRNIDATINNKNGSINDIAPGGNKAILTLANGKRVLLSDGENEMLLTQSGTKIIKASDGILLYSADGSNKELTHSKEFNIIETPKGGTYRLRLPDGTHVWLNSASTFKYPVSFSSHHERRVLLLSGEAYFEVVKDKKHPFIVQTNKQEVEVLGTHFNINTYDDEPGVKTTLLEGIVSVSILNKQGELGKAKILKPNEQAVFNGLSLSITEVNTDDVVDWKNGQFTFDDEPIDRVMRKIARWYDVDIEFKGRNKDQIFSGSISRFEHISKVLEKLEMTGGVHFKLEGRRVIVMK